MGTKALWTCVKIICDEESQHDQEEKEKWHNCSKRTSVKNIAVQVTEQYNRYKKRGKGGRKGGRIPERKREKNWDLSFIFPNFLSIQEFPKRIPGRERWLEHRRVFTGPHPMDPCNPFCVSVSYKKSGGCRIGKGFSFMNKKIWSA